MSNDSDTKSKRFRLVRVDSMQFAIDDEQITTFVDWHEPTPLPFAPKALIGVVCIQGRMFTVLDLIKMLHPEQTDTLSSSSYIVALRGDEQLALAVNSIGEPIEVLLSHIRSMEPVPNELVRETLEHEQSDWQVIEVDQLFNSLVQGKERRRRRS
ncbi:MAG: hypothetical protein C5B55_02800 [Blastocatellia bacterium]|nr:MAG: hypothetical protein C5B55_02800 [Blastocatellia bacterium]